MIFRQLLTHSVTCLLVYSTPVLSHLVIQIYYYCYTVILLYSFIYCSFINDRHIYDVPYVVI
jgi:hypothetical protein